MRPRMRTANQAVFDRIIVDVIDVAGQVCLIADAMLPKAFLPDTSLVSSVSRTGNGRFRSARSGPRFHETPLDGGPAGGIIGVVFRQSPDAMEMIRQQDDGRHLERLLALHNAENLPETPSCPIVCEDPSAALRHQREEERAALQECASVIRHCICLVLAFRRWCAEHTLPLSPGRVSPIPS